MLSFNQDHGTGRIQNVSAAGLIGAVPALPRWVAALPDDISRNVTFGLAATTPRWSR